MMNIFSLSRQLDRRAKRTAQRMVQRAWQKGQNGFLSLELGLVLLVVAGAIVAGVLSYRDNLRKTSINNNTQQISSIAANLRSKYGQSNMYGSVTTALAVRSQAIPEFLRDGTNATASNSFGGAITVTPVTLTGANDSVQLVWPNVPANQCSDIVTNVQREMRQITVGTTSVKANNGQINLTALETACEASTAATLNFWIGRS
ncbi:MAG: type 4 pilus major pilin [Giesbergeria sp.]|uniref:type 4 pilus major pilin n=1 Tax=Giesbergeria sp. TaxID=2818473 RepID=UPI00262F0FFD|nr:type 4 pilus major pilin [Giesbergeria sp.]MDD2609465.1 type 4 pilus major pilin [Giesbergeria sp.]